MFLVLLDHWTLSEQQSSAGAIAGGIGVGGERRCNGVRSVAT